MIRLCWTIAALLLLWLIYSDSVLASPSSTFWTPCTIDIVPKDISVLNVNNFFGFGSDEIREVLPVDTGCEWGAQLTPKLAAEYGFDLFSSPSPDPLYLNAKIGFRENTISHNAPAIQLGFFGFSTQRNNKFNNQDITYLIIGKSLPGGRTRLSAAYYVGRAKALRSSTGEVESNGYMVAMDHVLVPGKWILAADYASGKNVIGGGGIGVYYYFSEDTNIEFGPVWFNDTGLNGSTKLGVQVSINF